MKKIILISLWMALLPLNGNAQILKGDMNGDGKLNVSDVITSVNMIIGKQEQSFISISDIVNPYVVDNSKIVGTWYKSKTESVTFGSDNTTNYPEAVGYRYQPFLGRVLLYNSSGLPFKSVEVAYEPSDTLFLDYEVFTRSIPVCKVSSISLNETSVSLKTSATIQLAATVLPEDADDPSVIWSSNNESVATVHDGLVTAVAPGSTIITCASADGGAKAECSVTVTKPILIAYIELNHHMIVIEPQATRQLSANIYFNADNPTVTWSSSNERIATVVDGMVTAKAIGTAFIRCIAADGSGKKDSCKVIVRNDRSGTENGHAYVDLGLSSGTLWAATNIGASTPEGFGNYYSWGETEVKDVYSEYSYEYCYYDTDELTKYCIDRQFGHDGYVDYMSTLNLQDDAANVNWGDGWYMPTVDQFAELYKECTQEWTTQNGVNGMLVTGPSGKSIFFPAAGQAWIDHISYGAGSHGYYWTRELDELNSPKANLWEIGSNTNFVYGHKRFYGMSVRAIRNY